jgi:hypothetical protein
MRTIILFVGVVIFVLGAGPLATGIVQGVEDLGTHTFQIAAAIVGLLVIGGSFLLPKEQEE